MLSTKLKMYQISWVDSRGVPISIIDFGYSMQEMNKRHMGCTITKVNKKLDIKMLVEKHLGFLNIHLQNYIYEILERHGDFQ